MNGKLNIGVQHGYLRANRFKFALGLRDITLGSLAAGDPRFRERQRILSSRDILFGDFESQLRSPQFAVVTRHIAKHGNQNISSVLFGSDKVAFGFFNAAPNSPEQIDLPGEIRIDVVGVRFIIETLRAALGASPTPICRTRVTAAPAPTCGK
jgi:hypothetical protein